MLQFVLNIYHKQESCFFQNVFYLQKP